MLNTLGELVALRRGVYVDFREINHDRVAEIRAAVLSRSKLDEYNRLLQSIGDPARRYKDIEYRHDVYHSYKPGIDDGLERILGYKLSTSCVVELGGGPSYLARQADKGVCVDIAEHPDLSSMNNVAFLEVDICSPDAAEAIINLVRAGHGDNRVLIVLSYCLDRVRDQRNALSTFCRLVKGLNAQGLITVDLPTKSSSSGCPDISYRTDRWVTTGESSLSDYEAIVGACCAGDAGLRFLAGGRTLHFGASLDAFECLDCYVMLFTH